jgi:hypothetical protein
MNLKNSWQIKNSMKNKIIILGFVLLLSIGAYYIFLNHNKIPIISGNVFATSTFDGKNSTFTIDGNPVTLVNGVSIVQAVPGSASKITTRYFGNESYGDINGDGLEDTAFLVTQSTGGSGIFYYVVVALNTPIGYKTTNAFLIGDRIAPQTTQINSSAKELYVNFAERKPGEPMTVRPSQGVTLYLKVTPSGILEGLMK